MEYDGGYQRKEKRRRRRRRADEQVHRSGGVMERCRRSEERKVKSERGISKDGRGKER